jgi:Vitelline membrane outer layer protein I (VOMI)
MVSFGKSLALFLALSVYQAKSLDNRTFSEAESNLQVPTGAALEDIETFSEKPDLQVPTGAALQDIETLLEKPDLQVPTGAPLEDIGTLLEETFYLQVPTGAALEDTRTLSEENPDLQVPTGAALEDSSHLDPTDRHEHRRLASSDLMIYAGVWGSWKSWEGFNPGYYACGAQVRFEDSQGGGDDTAANGLNLRFCYYDNWWSQKDVMIYPGIWGNWRNMVTCPTNKYIIGMQVRFEDPTGE